MTKIAQVIVGALGSWMVVRVIVMVVGDMHTARQKDMEMEAQRRLDKVMEEENHERRLKQLIREALQESLQAQKGVPQ